MWRRRANVEAGAATDIDDSVADAKAESLDGAAPNRYEKGELEVINCRALTVLLHRREAVGSWPLSGKIRLFHFPLRTRRDDFAVERFSEANH